MISLIRRLLVLTFVVGLSSVSAADNDFVSILLPKDYGRSYRIDLNGKSVAGPDTVDQLAKMIIEHGRNTPVVVLVPDSLRFTDYYNIRGIIQKVGFLNVRYFLYTEETKKMVQFDIVAEAREFSRNPGP